MERPIPCHSMDQSSKRTHFKYIFAKNVFLKLQKSSAELAINIFVNLRMHRQKFRKFSYHSFTNSDLHLLWKFHGNSCRIRDFCMQNRFQIPLSIKFWTSALTPLRMIGPISPMCTLNATILAEKNPPLCGNQWKCQFYSTHVYTKDCHSGCKDLLKVPPVFQENL